MTTTNRHRVVSVDGYWAPAGIPSTLAADVSLNSASRDISSVLPMSSYSTSMDPSLSTNLYHHQPLSLDPTMRTRRSHRPRGCRGGRKNRKPKISNQDIQQPNSPPYHSSYDASRIDNEQYGNTNHHYSNEASCLSFPATASSVAVKGDLSPYQHLKISPKPWNFGLRGNENNDMTNTVSAPSIKQQMLPPPVPSALFDSHRQNMELMNQNNNNLSGSGLKMLPSFDDDEIDDGHKGDGCDDYYHQYYDNNDDDDDDSSESIEFGMTIPKPPQRLGDVHHTPSRRGMTYGKHDSNHSRFIPSMQNDNCEATVDTASSRSRTSSSSSDDSALVTTKETNLRTINNFSIHKPHQLQQPSHTFLKSPVAFKTFSLPILHLHIIPPPPSSLAQQGQQQPTTGSSCTNSSTNSGGFGSLFVTSPRSFLFGIGRSGRQTQITHHQ